MYKEALRPSWVEVNLANLEHNVRSIKAKVGDGVKLIGVIKADAYGCGAVRCAKVLEDNGFDTFAIATLGEGVELREAGYKENIICLGLNPPMYAEEVVKYDIITACDSSETAAALSDAAQKQGKTAEIMIALDTGMGRIGYLAEEAEASAEDIKKITALPALKIHGMFSHFATADSIDLAFTKLQAARYKHFAEVLKENGIDLPMKSLANSAAIMEVPEAYYDYARPGIILYGCYPSNEVHPENLDIKPVMQVKANLVKVKDVPSGTSVGYGRKYISRRPSKIATINIGYADGMPRPYSPNAFVIINGVKAPVAGNVCMDQFMVDVTDVPNVKVGDEAIIMGTDGRLSITAEEIAEKTGTINYEVMSCFGLRLPKVYIEK
ncbi:MAG: alanine racemase [Eubacteriaceae bacterium]|jgi:alanine racemase|nr:alanine racemase [Eubacteriaceae bacterium]